MAASGVSAVVSLALITVGFLLATAAVVALARTSTARWERDKRAAVAVRADVSTGRTSAAGSGLGRLIDTTRSAMVALRGHVARFAPVAVLARVLPEGMQHSPSRVRPIRRLVRGLRPSLTGGRSWLGRWTTSGSPALPVDGDTAPAPGPARAATDSRAAGRRLLRRTVPRGRRSALAFLHRHADARAAHVPHQGSDERPAAR